MLDTLNRHKWGQWNPGNQRVQSFNLSDFLVRSMYYQSGFYEAQQILDVSF